MRKDHATKFLYLALLLIATAMPAWAQENGQPDLIRVFVGFRQVPAAAEQAIVRGAGGSIRYSYQLIPVIATKIPDQAVEALLRNPNVEYVELDHQVRMINYSTELNNSWGVKRIGGGTVHVNGIMGTGVKVAVLDTGIDYNHADLGANYKGGYDFVNSDSDPMDDEGHGTVVAGVVAALRNGWAVVGAAPEAHVYGLKVLDETGGGYHSDIVAAIEWCVINDMDIINMSLGGSQGSTPLQNACQAAYNAGVLLIAAAGNSGRPAGNTDTVEFPARYTSVMAVAATNESDKRPSWSSTGDTVEIAAPGTDIISTYLNGQFVSASGTSFSAPHVAGVAALIKTVFPNYSNVEIRARLTSTADNIGSARHFGHGLVNAVAATYVEADAKLLTVTSSPFTGVQITGSAPGTTTYGAEIEHESTVQLTAPSQASNNNASYSFVRWVVGATEHPIGQTQVSFVMNVDLTATAVYQIIKHNLSVVSSPLPGVDITGTHPGTTDYDALVDDQENVVLNAPAYAATGGVNYQFVRWVAGATEYTIGQLQLSFAMTGNVTATAVYEITKHDLAVASSPLPGVQITGTHPGTTDYNALVDDQSNVMLDAPAYAVMDGANYKFVRWVVGGVDQAEDETELVFVMTGDIDVLAVYSIFYTLTVAASSDFEIDIDGDPAGTTGYTVHCNDGQQVNLIAPPFIIVEEIEYLFVRWVLNDVPQDRREFDITITVTEDTSALASYTFFGDMNEDCKADIADLIFIRNMLGRECPQ